MRLRPVKTGENLNPQEDPMITIDSIGFDVHKKTINSAPTRRRMDASWTKERLRRGAPN